MKETKNRWKTKKAEEELTKIYFSPFSTQIENNIECLHGDIATTWYNLLERHRLGLYLRGETENGIWYDVNGADGESPNAGYSIGNTTRRNGGKTLKGKCRKLTWNAHGNIVRVAEKVAASQTKWLTKSSKWLKKCWTKNYCR